MPIEAKFCLNRSRSSVRRIASTGVPSTFTLYFLRMPFSSSSRPIEDRRARGTSSWVGERVGAVTQQTPWMRWKMVGFGLSGEITETLQIESVRCLGGVNLLWHDEWTSLLAYQGDPVSLRENPIICAPNCVEFSLRNVGKYPVQFSLWALGEPVESAL